MNRLGKKALAAALAALLFAACARPAAPPGAAKEPKGKHVYKDLKAEVYPLPETVKQALPGLLNDNAYVYREILPAVFLVAYVPDYSADSAVKMAAKAFLGLIEVPEFTDQMDFLILQIQPKPVDKKPIPDETLRVLVWGVKPAEVVAYKDSGDLKAFLESSEYLLVDDVIIDKGAKRSEAVGLEIEPMAGSTAGPSPGSTVAPGNTAPTPP